MKKIILFLLVFYFIYPQGLDIGGSSFIIVAGPIGLLLYAYNKLPFREVITLLFGFGILLFVYISLGQINDTFDPYITSFIRSQLAWFFAAYLTIFVLFSAYKDATFNTLLFYIVFVVAAQAIIAITMELNPAVRDFFLSIQLDAEYTEEKMDAAEGQRLVGYATAFFGAGAIYGYALIFNAYLMVKANLNKKQFIFMAIIFCLIFYAGLFSARTTIVGLVVAIVLILTYYIKDRRTENKRVIWFFLIFLVLAAVGFTLVNIYLSQFTDWAFELFNNYLDKGTLETKSSNGLEGMFYTPDDFHTFMFGNGSFGFFGADVGYTRLWFFVGAIGTFSFFIYQLLIIKLSFTRDWTINILLLYCFLYILALNVKGYMDMNYIFYLIFFYFTYYKQYVYEPQRYALGKNIRTS